MKRLAVLGFLLLILAPLSIFLQPVENKQTEVITKPAGTPPITVIPVPSPASIQPGEVTAHSLLIELNRRRELAGVHALQLDQRLMKSAQAKCDDMLANNYYGHVNPVTGVHGYELAKEHLKSTIGSFGENLNSPLQVATTPKEIFDSWFKSETHKTAALSDRYTLTGFGYCNTSVSVPRGEYKTVVEHFYGPR